MMAPPELVVLFRDLRLSVYDGPEWFAPRSFVPFPHPKAKGSAEQQADALLRDLVPRLRDFTVLLRATTSEGAFAARIRVKRGRFETCRRSLAEAYVALAHRARTPESVQRWMAKARRLDARDRTKETNDLVERVKPPSPLPQFSRVARPLPRWEPNAVESTHCHGCNRRYPRLIGYQDGEPVLVPQMHRAWTKSRRPFGGTPPLCRSVAREWSLLDPRPLQPLDHPHPEEAPPEMDRDAWMDLHLAAAPIDLGGPLTDQRQVLADAVRLRAGAAA